MTKTRVDNIKYMQAIYDKFKRILCINGAQSLFHAYKKPSAAKCAAWIRIYDEYSSKANAGTLTVISANCQKFTVGLMMQDIFVYITKSYIAYWKVKNDKLICQAKLS